MNTIAWRADYMALFGQIRRARKAHKITQVQAAEIIGMTERSYRDIENGHKDISAENLFRLCAALGIRVFDPQAQNRKVPSGVVADAQAAAIRREMLGIKDAPALEPASEVDTEGAVDRLVSWVAEREASHRKAMEIAATAVPELGDLPAAVNDLLAEEQYREAFMTWMDEQAKGDQGRWFTLLLIVWYQVHRGPWAALAAPEGLEALPRDPSLAGGGAG